jgi:hypothetical protein
MACNGNIPGNGGIMVKNNASGYYRSIIVVVLFLMLFCTAIASAVDCSSGCSCLLPADVKEKGYSPCGGQLSICGYDRYQNPMYCYNSGLTVALRTLSPLSVITTAPPGTCPDGCSCMMESAAKEKFGVYTRCSETPCYTVVTGSAAVNAYCFRQGTTPTPVTCPQGCDCISEVTAKAKGGSFTRCSADICGYEQSTVTIAAVVQVPKYCMKQESTTPVCPDGCTCLSDANAKARYGEYARCSADVCGYEQSTSTVAAVVQVPKYCVKPQTTTTPTPVCPDGCACISDEDAKLKGLVRCDSSQTPCDYKSVTATANTAATRIPLYCYKVSITTTPTPQVCPEGCWCVQDAVARAKFGDGNYSRCSEKTCGYDQSATAANGIPRYCFRPTNSVTVTPTPAVCPQGCVCTTDEIAKSKELTGCRGVRVSCGYDANKVPQYCFEQVPSTTCVYDYQKNACTGTCQQGYNCGLVASSRDASGKVDYAVCGCTGQQTCAYDAQKNACTGTCADGKSCVVVGKETDKQTGKETPVCGCPQSSCTYDYSKSSCIGTCTATGDNCQLNTIYRDPATGKVTYAECHCKGAGDVTPTPVSQLCSCDPAGGVCSGTCPEGKTCRITETANDSMGKVSCTACNCKEICSLAPDGSCNGGCPDGSPCVLQTYTDPGSGASKSGCGCVGAAPASAAAPAKAQAPDIFTAIGTFFRSLFGMK